MRIGFTILYNGIHHLKHQNFSQFMVKNFDYWIVIEGLTAPGGSTSWCKNLLMSPRSTDGSHQFMESLSKMHPNVVYYSPGTKWPSKDAMVNEAIKIVNLVTDECYLWQVDVDEVWRRNDLTTAEFELSDSECNAGAFQFHHMICKMEDGRQLVGGGEWGDNWNTRLWKWNKQRFVSHEPPVLSGQSKVMQLSPVYDHYSYYFKEDVLFKGKLYGGHEYVPRGWEELRTGKYKTFPQPLTALFGPDCKKFDPKRSFIDVYKNKRPCQNQNAAEEKNLVVANKDQDK